jgi:GNAT superfamily N-acetyltransferase
VSRSRSGAPATAPRIRPFERGDAEDVAALLQEIWPHLVLSPARLLHDLENAPERAHMGGWVGVAGGEISGYGEGHLRWRAADPTVANLWVAVHPEARGAGLGTALHEQVVAHLASRGARTLRSWVADEGGRRFAARQGYAETRREQLWTLDPRDADLSELPELSGRRREAGYRVVRLRDLLGRPRDLHALYAEAEDDIPSDDVRGELDYEEWERETLQNPLLDADASVTILKGDRPVSFAWLLVDRKTGRAEHELTGTVRDERGRGLARLAKLAALRWCADHGVHTVLTANDSENAAMLRINERLGYRATVISSEIAKTIG